MNFNTIFSKLFILFTGMILLMLFATSCQKDEELLTTDAPAPTPTVEEKNYTEVQDHNATLDKVANTLSKVAIKHPSVMKNLKKLAIKSEKDGHSDVEFFYHLVKDKQVLDDAPITFKELLIQNGMTSKEEEELCNVPGLAFLLIGNMESTDFLDRIYLDDGFDDSDLTSLIKFYEDGERSEHEIRLEPEMNTFVVRISEVYAAPGTYNYELHKNIPGAFKIIGETSCGKEIAIIGRNASKTTEIGDDAEDHLNNGETATTRDMSCGMTCERDCANLTDNLAFFRTTNQHDPWRGKGEFFWLIIGADNVSYNIVNGAVVVTGNAFDNINTGIFGSVKKDTWYAPNYSSWRWNLNQDGDEIKYVAYESDGGNTTTIDVTVGGTFQPVPMQSSVTLSATIPITINDGDDFIGETVADYCHDIFGFSFAPFSICWGFQYNYGSVRMHLNER